MKVVQREDFSFDLSQEKFIEILAKNFHIDENTKPVFSPFCSGHKLIKDMCPETEDEKRETGNRPYQSLVGD